MTFGSTLSMAGERLASHEFSSRAAAPAACPGATQALIRRRSLRTIDVPHIGWLQLIDELSEGSSY